MKLLNLSENELLDINGGNDLPDIGGFYRGVKDVYDQLRDHDFDAIGDFCNGFAEGWNSPDN